MSNDDFEAMKALERLAFRNNAITGNLIKNLQHMDIDIYLLLNKANMIPHNISIHLELLLKKGLTKADVGRGSLLNRKYVYQIFSGEKTF